MFKKVFISYAKEDIKHAEQLYEFLLEKKFDPWLDEKKLRIGANWDLEIKRALKESNFVILLLSSNSVNKRGYVQKEFKLALNYAETKLVDDIYIMPVLLNKCNVPDNLTQFQWVELNDKNYKYKILESIQYQQAKLVSSLPYPEIELSNYGLLKVNLNKNFKIDVNYNCSVPQFLVNKYFDIDFPNKIIQKYTIEAISSYSDIISDIELSAIHDSIYLDIDHHVKFINENLISLYININSYFGGPYPRTSIKSFNLNVYSQETLSIKDVLVYDNLKGLLTEILKNYGDEDQKVSLGHYFEFCTEESINFSFDHNWFEFDFSNHVPHVIQALGYLQIPISELKTKPEFISLL